MEGHGTGPMTMCSINPAILSLSRRPFVRTRSQILPRGACGVCRVPRAPTPGSHRMEVNELSPPLSRPKLHHHPWPTLAEPRVRILPLPRLLRGHPLSHPGGGRHHLPHFAETPSIRPVRVTGEPRCVHHDAALPTGPTRSPGPPRPARAGRAPHRFWASSPHRRICRSYCAASSSLMPPPPPLASSFSTMAPALTRSRSRQPPAEPCAGLASAPAQRAASAQCAQWPPPRTPGDHVGSRGSQAR